MTFLTKIERDRRIRKQVLGYEENRRYAKGILLDRRAELEDREEIFEGLVTTMSHHRSRTVAKARCLLTGNSRNVVRYFRLHRMSVKEIAVQGELPGIRRGYTL